MSVQLTGQRHWQRPDKLRIRREAGWAYRFIKKSDVERRLDEGWEIVVKPLKVEKESGPLDRAQHYRGLVLMRIPQHMADERNQFYLDKHSRRLRAVARGAHMNAVRAAATSENKDSNSLAGTIGRGLELREGVVTNEGLVHTNNQDIPVQAHPDDLAADVETIQEIRDKQASDSEEKEPSPSKSKYKKRR